MGLTKTILFGDNPAHDGIRQAMSEAAGRRRGVTVSPANSDFSTTLLAGLKKLQSAK
jgi:hypothetical protein